MRWLLRAFLVIVAVLTFAVAVLVLFVPSSALERHILTAASRATGTQISSTGSPEITLFPSISMKLRDVTIRPRDNNDTALKAKQVEASVGWLPLLTLWTVNIEVLRIIEPELQFAADSGAGLESLPDVPPKRRAYPTPRLAIGKVSIVDGTVSGLGENWRIKDIDATTETTDFNQPAKLNLVMFVNGEKVIGYIDLKEPAAIRKSENIPLKASFKAATGNVEIDGVAAIGDKPNFHGRLQLSSGDLAAAGRWLGIEVPSDFDKQAASLDGQVAYEPGSITFENSAVTAGELKANFGGRIEQGGETLALTSVELGDLTAPKTGPMSILALDQLRLNIDRLQSGAPLKADVAFMHNDKPVTGVVQVPDLDMLAGKAPQAVAAFTVPGGQVEFDGSLVGGDASGKIKFAADAPRETASWLGVTLPDGEGYQTVELSGDIVSTEHTVEITNSKFKLDGSNGGGYLGLDFSGDQSVVSGKVTVDAIDSARYVAGGADGPQPMPAASPSTTTVAQLESAPQAPYQIEFEPIKPTLEAHIAAGTGGPSPVTAQNFESLLPALNAAWSKSSLGLDALKDVTANADLDVSVGDLRHGNIALGKTSFVAKLQKGRLDLDIREAGPLDGHINGQVNIDATADQPAFKVDLTATAVPVDNVVSQTGAKRDVIRGKLSGTAKLSASGNNEAELIASLKGSINSEVKDGAIVGYDIRRVVRPFANRQYNPNRTTPFNALKAKFEIDNGVAQSPNIALDGPGVRIRATGRANLKTTAIDYSTNLALVPPPSNFSLPLKIQGTWSRIKAAIDWAALATAWTGPSPFNDFESARKPSSGDPELDQLLGELVAKGGRKTVPPTAAALMREITASGR